MLGSAVQSQQAQPQAQPVVRSKLQHGYTFAGFAVTHWASYTPEAIAAIPGKGSQNKPAAVQSKQGPHLAGDPCLIPAVQIVKSLSGAAW